MSRSVDFPQRFSGLVIKSRGKMKKQSAAYAATSHKAIACADSVGNTMYR